MIFHIKKLTNYFTDKSFVQHNFDVKKPNKNKETTYGVSITQLWLFAALH